MTARAVVLAGLVACGGGGHSTQSDAPLPDAPGDAPILRPDAPPDGPPPLSVDEAPDCGGDPLIARGGDLALAVSALQILTVQAAYDLDGNGQPDNKLAAVASLAQDSIADGLADGSFAVPIEIFDRDAVPDACVKLALYRGSCATAACNFTDATPDTVALDPTSIGPGGVPSSRLRSMMVGAGGAVTAAPGYVEITVPITTDIVLPLPITTIRADGTLTAAGLTGFRIGGVLQAFRLEQAPAPIIPQIGTMAGDSMIDLMFANLFGPLLALPKSTVMPECRTPDIDVDGDGLETFCDSNPNDDPKRIDLCIDGDGTVIHDGDGGVAQCTLAMKNGVPRFQDGISVGLVLDARAATIAP